MSLEKKIKKCIWKGHLDSEKKIYGKLMADYDLIIKENDSFLYKNCKDCKGKNKKCNYYFPIR